MTNFPLLRMKPFLAPRPWGGDRLGKLLGKGCEAADKIGESWEVSDHPEGLSRIDSGPFDGETFRDVLRAHPSELIGRPTPPARFPLLIKYIDAAEDLSIQVHPDDAYTEKSGLSDRGKTECWYVVDCAPGAEIIHGLKPGVGPDELSRSIEERRVPDVVRRIPIKPGLFLFVPAGTVHAILAGTLICEIQQASNLTYRLWDWDRKPERELHIDESLAVASYEVNPPEPLRVPTGSSLEPTLTLLTRNEYFEVQAVTIPAGQCFRESNPGVLRILNGVKGTAEVGGQRVDKGDTIVIPASHDQTDIVCVDAPATLLLTRSLELSS